MLPHFFRYFYDPTETASTLIGPYRTSTGFDDSEMGISDS